jgi:P27 family predicted phage terminase small subunit
MPGPPPTPARLKLLRGNPGKRPIRPELQPEQPPTPPEPPDFLTGYAVGEWRRIAPELHRLGLLTVLDLTLAAYCTAYARWRTTEELLAGMDPDPRPKVLIRIATQAARDMARCGREFGMSPSDEGRALRLTCGVSRASSATCSASVAPSFPAHTCD